MRMFEEQNDRRGKRENLPKDFLFNGEQELLRQIHDLKEQLGTDRWSESKTPKITKPSFLRTDLSDDELSLYLFC